MLTFPGETSTGQRNRLPLAQLNHLETFAEVMAAPAAQTVHASVSKPLS
jgi:hypothetical protein